MIQPGEARELCSKSEWELVQGSFSPMVETFSSSDLKSRIARIRKLHQKTTDLVGLQHSDSRKRTTRRKSELFAEVVGRFEATLNVVEKARNAEPVLKDVENEKMAEETRNLNMDALRKRDDREVESRMTQSRYALGLRGKEQGQKSGAKHIQSHTGSVTRRNQAKRDTKNR